MPSSGNNIDKISDSDRRLMQRVKQLVMQARISEGLLQAHFAAEYDLSDSRYVLEDGTIREQMREDGRERQD